MKHFWNVLLNLISRFLLLTVLFLPAVHAQDTKENTFNHSTTGFDLSGTHAFITCESCHQGGRFAGTPTQCNVCHNLNGLVNATPKPASHITTSEACDTCHRETIWDDIARVDHTQVIGSCNNCHNNFTAAGMPPGHPVTSAECNACHSDFGWLPARFDHNNITSGCISCHDNLTATGKNPDHVLSSDFCENCHSTIAWLPASVNHDDVIGSCSTCHNNIIATGKDPNHLPTVAECNLCHSTVAWTPATFDHSTVNDGCMNCHNGTTATGKDPGHFVTNQECNYCHTITSWTPDIFTHSSPNYPGDHRRNLNCRDCHRNNAEAVTWNFPSYMPNCAGCHANDFENGPHKKVDSPRIFYTVGELQDCSGACHEYTDSTFTTIRRMRSGEHRVRDSEF